MNYPKLLHHFRLFVSFNLQEKNRKRPNVYNFLSIHFKLFPVRIWTQGETFVCNLSLATLVVFKCYTCPYVSLNCFLNFSESNPKVKTDKNRIWDLTREIVYTLASLLKATGYGVYMSTLLYFCCAIKFTLRTGRD